MSAPLLTAGVGQWWQCFGPAAGVGSLTGAGIAVTKLGKLQLDPHGLGFRIQVELGRSL